MPRALPRDPIYRRRRFASSTIELCVQWYLTYRLSYRDLVAMMADRGVAVTHTTIMRWVIRYVPEYEKRWARFARPVGSSWRMDETAVSIMGRLHYVYRAVDKAGKSVHSMLSDVRSVSAALALFPEFGSCSRSRLAQQDQLGQVPGQSPGAAALGREGSQVGIRAGS